MNECQRCHKAPAVRLIGTVAHCHACAEAFLAPIRQRTPVIKVRRPQRLHRDGEAYWWRCYECGATWKHEEATSCDWCINREAAMHEDERKRLLFPPWATNGGQRYDELSDVDKEVWRHTRGQRKDDASLISWVDQLGDAVRDNNITIEEARSAVRRVLGRE